MINLSGYPASHIIRTFDIEAISLPIVYNKYGDHDPNGLLYVLKEDSQRIQQKARENFALTPPQPYKEMCIRDRTTTMRSIIFRFSYLICSQVILKSHIMRNCLTVILF